MTDDIGCGIVEMMTNHAGDTTMYHPDEIEEMEYQLHAQADYLSEAFGDEARLLANEDKYEYADEPLSAADQTALDLFVARRHVECYAFRAQDKIVPF